MGRTSPRRVPTHPTPGSTKPAAYARLRQFVEPVAEERGAQVVRVMGNHDGRATYAAELFGDITDAQLTWLADVLATPAPHGTLPALHHPPISIPDDGRRRGDRAVGQRR